MTPVATSTNKTLIFEPLVAVKASTKGPNYRSSIQSNKRTCYHQMVHIFLAPFRYLLALFCKKKLQSAPSTDRRSVPLPDQRPVKGILKKPGQGPAVKKHVRFQQ